MMILPDNVFSLVCDEIRREDNGKLIMIGVYVGEILVPTFPANLRLTIWAQWKSPAKNAESFELDLKVEVEDGEPLRAKGVINGPTEAGDDVLLHVSGVPVKATKPTTMKLSVKVEGSDEWRELAQKRIELMPSATTAS